MRLQQCPGCKGAYIDYSWYWAEFTAIEPNYERECTSVSAIWTYTRWHVQYGRIPIIRRQKLHQLSRTRACALAKSAYRKRVRARRAGPAAAGLAVMLATVLKHGQRKFVSVKLCSGCRQSTHRTPSAALPRPPLLFTSASPCSRGGRGVTSSITPGFALKWIVQ